MKKPHGYCKFHHYKHHNPERCPKCFLEQMEVRINAIMAPLIRSRTIITYDLLKK